MKEKSKKRTICVFNGKRGGFNAMTPTMLLIKDDPDLKLEVVLTDMHLSEEFGKTIVQAEKWFDISERVDMEQRGDSPEDRAEALGMLLRRITFVLNKLKPDIILMLGDRSETLVCAFAALQLRIPVAHIQGGEISGNIDGIQRHAITKLAHIHFTETQEAYKRVLDLGEEKERVFLTGAPYVDFITKKLYSSEKDVRKKFMLKDNEKFFLVLQHPVTTEPELSYKHMKEIINALIEFPNRCILAYPCSDQGYQGVIDAIREVKDNSKFLIFKNIEAPDFLGLQSIAEVFVGNSSAGIYEAPYFYLPVVNVGSRQTGRERENNIIDVNPNKYEIKNAINKAINDKEFRNKLKKLKYIYGDGNACTRIVEVLKNVSIDKKFFEKKITF